MSEVFFKEQELQKNTSVVSDEFLAKYQNNNILITGAGGSIGSKIVEELTKINCKNIILLDQSELNLFHIKKKKVLLTIPMSLQTLEILDVLILSCSCINPN